MGSGRLCRWRPAAGAAEAESRLARHRWMLSAVPAQASAAACEAQRSFRSLTSCTHDHQSSPCRRSQGSFLRRQFKFMQAESRQPTDSCDQAFTYFALFKVTVNPSKVGKQLSRG